MADEQCQPHSYQRYISRDKTEKTANFYGRNQSATFVGYFDLDSTNKTEEEIKYDVS